MTDNNSTCCTLAHCRTNDQKNDIRTETICRTQHAAEDVTGRITADKHYEERERRLKTRTSDCRFALWEIINTILKCLSISVVPYYLFHSLKNLKCETWYKDEENRDRERLNFGEI